MTMILQPCGFISMAAENPGNLLNTAYRSRSFHLPSARRALKTGILFERVYNTGQHMAQYAPYADESPATFPPEKRISLKTHASDQTTPFLFLSNNSRNDYETDAIQKYVP
ncbi:hypothetical protein PUN28_016367, partial [Cardiocondyla obscurior]